MQVSESSEVRPLASRWSARESSIDELDEPRMAGEMVTTTSSPKAEDADDDDEAADATKAAPRPETTELSAVLSDGLETSA